MKLPSLYPTALSARKVFLTMLVFGLMHIGKAHAQQHTNSPDITILTEQYLNKTDEKGHKQGYWQYRPENENVVMDVYFRNDTMMGDCKIYDATGRLIENCRYQNNRLNGYFRKFAENGAPIEEGCFDDGSLVGLHKVFWKNGNLKIFSVYIAGDLDGPYIEYSENGKIKIQSRFMEGRKSGSEKIYAKDGKTAVIENYFDNGTRILTAIRDKKGALLEVISRDQNPLTSTNYKNALTW